MRFLSKIYRPLAGVMALTFMCVALSLAQDATSASTGHQVADATEALVEVVQGKKGVVVVVAALLTLLMQLFKYPLLGGIVYKIPTNVRFYVPYVLAGIAGILTDIGNGTPWINALIMAITAGPLSTVFHQAHKTVRPKALEPVRPQA